jgi:CheY-like chemotaxis protein
MTCMNITMSEESGGWFVIAHNRLGPYVCREQAYNLASGMVDAICASGGEAALFVLDGQTLRPVAATPPAALPPAPVGWSRPSAFGPGPNARGPAPDADGHALRVLCAEDNLANQKVLEIFLEMAGVVCTMVDNGAEAVAAWGREPWDIILMDIQMPVMDGLSATQAIRALEVETGRSRTPILATTANVMPEQITAYLAAGLDAVVSKPITAPVLLAEMGAALDSPHGPLANAAAIAEARLAPVSG